MKGASLMPWANRIANGTYNFYGKTYNLPVNEPERNDAMHGFLFKTNLELHVFFLKKYF